MRTDIDPSDPESPSYKMAFEEYKLLLDWTNKLADRRQVTSNLFLGVNSAIVATLAVVATAQPTGQEGVLLLSGLTLFGLLISVVWLSLLSRYREILRFKYAHLQLLERVLQINNAGLVTAENDFFRHGRQLEAYGYSNLLETPKRLGIFGITLAESILPQVFGLIFGVVFLLSGFMYIRNLM